VLKLNMTKVNKAHFVALSTPATDILQNLGSRGRSDWLFPTYSKSGHLSDPHPAWIRVRDRAGVRDCTIHDLRHSFAAALVRHGFGLQVIGRALGHSRISTTQRYSHLEMGPVAAAVEVHAQQLTALVGNSADI